MRRGVGEMPRHPPTMVREKDRACYRHQLCQVDLTVVTARVGGVPAPQPTLTWSSHLMGDL